jgi:curved DNA-binding protein CbpA
MVDPYHILGVSKRFTLEELKEKYKAIAVKVHPDKGGTQELFLLVTKCYKALLKEYERQRGQKEYHELKSDFKKNMQQPSQPRPQSKFDLDKFNQVFSENRLNNAYDNGYQDWIKNTGSDEPYVEEVDKKAAARKKQSFSADKFNSMFEKSTQVDKRNKYIVKYSEPEPIMASKKIMFTELGEDHVEDFSGDNTTKKNLNYMDYKVAHTTSKIVDPKLLQNVKTYKSIEELERHRGSISYDIEEDVAKVLAERERAEKLKEFKRQEAMRQHDEMVNQQHDRVNRLFLGRVTSH